MKDRELDKSEHYKRIEQFMRLAKQETPNSPKIPSRDVLKLRAKLIFEEALETINALGMTLEADRDCRYTFQIVDEGKEPDLIEVVDGICDISVVSYGTLISLGVTDKEVIELVDNNNLAKFGPGHTIRDDGKLVKPPNHQPPDIAKVIKLQGG